ncbi:uncharacterized protein VTP21DRAFT_11334 [Calcarisporiella thermophila]|uniref:uncharacterized protein n=1 Tax=Calcarisporiella thermophila TaxID=911321 RepID=UPI0037435B0D
MKPFCLLAVLFALLSTAMAADERVPDVEITGELENPIGVVVNGQRNKVRVAFRNHDNKQYTIEHMSGAFVNPNNFSHIIRNITAYRYGTAVDGNTTVDVPYFFYPEFPPQDLGLTVIIDFKDPSTGHTFRGVGFNSTVTVVDPEHSIFDLQLISIYLILAATAVGIGYLVKEAFFPATVASKKKKPVQPAPATTSTDSSEGSAVYDESWIPEHHLKARQTSAGKIKKRRA